MCDACKGFAKRIGVKTPREYRDILGQIDALTAAKVFRLVEGVSLKEILEAKQWPDDMIVHIFECTNCGQRFRLAVETYHGSGGTWEMMRGIEGIKSDHSIQ
jgi:hypothetical protein